MSKENPKTAEEKFIKALDDVIESAKFEMDENDFEIVETGDGSLILSCGKDGMGSDLVFAEGAIRNDPALKKQRKILEFILTAIKNYTALKKEDKEAQLKEDVLYKIAGKFFTGKEITEIIDYQPFIYFEIGLCENENETIAEQVKQYEERHSIKIPEDSYCFICADLPRMVKKCRIIFPDYPFDEAMVKIIGYRVLRLNEIK